MHGILSLDGHDKPSRMMSEGMEKLSIVFRGKLSPDQLEKIKTDIGRTVMPNPGQALADAGVNGDSMVAHMSPEQFASLGTDNPMNDLTGLPQAFADSGLSGEPDDVDDPAGVSAPSGGDQSEMGPTSPGVDETADRKDSPHGFGDPEGRSFQGHPGGPISPGQVAQMGIGGLGGYGFGYTDGYSEPPGKAGFSQVDRVAQATNQSRSQAIQSMVDARHSHNPTTVQNAINALTETAFANSMMGGITSGLVDIGKLAMPYSGVMSLVDMIPEDDRSFEDKVEDALGGPPPGQVAAVDAGINDPTAGMSDPVGANPTDPSPPSEPGAGMEEAPPEEFAQQDLVEIDQNFGSFDQFKSRFQNRFGISPTPELMNQPEVRAFVEGAKSGGV